MRYRILGATEAYDDEGSPVHIGGARLRTVLTALALRPGRAVGVDTLVDEVWGAGPPADAPAALQALVGRLRRALGREAILSAPGGYRLAAPASDVDLHRFESLATEGAAALNAGDAGRAAGLLHEALGLWHGPALADLPEAAPAARRAEGLRRTALRRRIEADLVRGPAGPLVPELRELAEATPYDEPLHALLLRALRADGRPADALAAYETLRRTLAEELGTFPGPELRRLYEELLREPEAEPEPEAGAREGDATGSGGPDAAREAVPGGPLPPPPPRGNLRTRLTSFVGREPELAAIRSDIDRARLVTLTGPGGSGKTRLAEEAAAGHPSAWLAELAPLERPEAVPGAVLSSLGLRDTLLRTSERGPVPQDPTDLLVEYCASRELLLVLDNCEHVIEAAAELAETLLTRCPRLTVLATSREPLGVPGESVRPVDPLPEGQAVRLFAERGAAVRPGFDVARDTAAVEEICRRLDGLPLAIELAAARLRLLDPRQIADRLDHRFRLLTNGSRTVLPRQQTLRAVVDWSWDLLDERERAVLCEASVFAGGWDLTAAEAVCSGPADALVGALVDKSLVVAAPDPGGDGMRYRMLETIHEYASERAAERPRERAGAGRRHTGHYRRLVATAEPLIRSGEQLPWIRKLETELDNIRAALFRAIAERDEESAVAMALDTCWFWWLRNYRLEGVAWAEHAMDLAGGFPAAVAKEFATSRPHGAEHDRGRWHGDTVGHGGAVGRGDTVGHGGAVGRGGTPGSAGAAAPVTTPAPATAAAGLAAPEPSDVLTALPPEDPRYWPRMQLRLLHLFLLSETRSERPPKEGEAATYIARLRQIFRTAGPRGARFPGLLWAFTAFFLDTAHEAGPLLDETVANCRRYGGDWELGVVLMFRTHVAVDTPGGLADVDRDLAELQQIVARTGDRWMRAQVAGARAELAMARSEHEEARAELEEALRLAYEVGAYAESPFLLARLGEMAYRAGNTRESMAHLDEAATAAEEYGAADARAYIMTLRAQLALDDGDATRARELCGQAAAEAERGTPPPQFSAALGSVEIQVTAAVSGPAAALPLGLRVLEAALGSRCTEVIVASLLEICAALFADLDRYRDTVRTLTVAGRLRGGLARPEPERGRAEALMARSRAALGPAGCTAAADGAATEGPADIVALLRETNSGDRTGGR